MTRVGKLLLFASYATLAAVTVMIVPSHTYTSAFWGGVYRETVFNFASWVH